MLLNFDDSKCLEVSKAGGKGASLARMSALGLPVPQGFVIPADVLARVVDAAALRAALPDHEKAQAIVADPRLAVGRIVDLIAEPAGQLTAEQRNFVRVLAENDRLPVLPDIAAQFEEKRHRHDNVLDVTVVSAYPVSEGQLVAWISYSAAPSTVVFEREVARAMVCHSLVNFTIQDDELKSAPIHAGEFASFCQLKPGRYKYKVMRTEPLKSGQDAARKLEGEIVVGNP